MTNHGSMDYPAHRQTYSGFVKLLKLVSLLVILTLVGMALTLL